MKKIFIVALFSILYGCNQHPKDYTTVSGNIKNYKDSVIYIRGLKFKKTIQVNEDGSFSDTLKVTKKGMHTLFLGKQRVGIFLNNGYNLTLQADINDFFSTLTFKGAGSETSNFIIANGRYAQKVGNPQDFFLLDKDPFLAKMEQIKNAIDSIEKIYDNVDEEVLKNSRKINKQFLDNMPKVYDAQHKRAIELKEKNDKIAKGKPSPIFKDYLNYKGGKNSLTDYLDSYVYIDLWATWCKPCIAQFPYFKEIKTQYQNRNIKFVSIATDDSLTARSWDKAEKLWRNMVKDKKLEGIQLFAEKDKSFTRDYLVGQIPRFILLDPKGNIVDSDAPRPSDPKLKRILDSVLTPQ